MAKNAYLVLENGTVFQGFSFGAEADMIGEIVFTTAMTGYLETLTDPSYYGQIVVQTFPLIGNYGVIPADYESARSWVKAYIVREWCQSPSNFRCEGDLDSFLKQQGVPGLWGIDTRRLTKIIRESGVMNAFITTDERKVPTGAELCRPYVITGAVNAVSNFDAYETVDEGECTVVLWDFGAKENIPRELIRRGCKVIRVPGSTAAEEVLAYEPDGIMLSNGPGDPAENTGHHRRTAKDRRLRRAGVRHLPGPPVDGLGHGRQNRKAALRPPRRQPAREGNRHRPRVYHHPEPRLCRAYPIPCPKARCSVMPMPTTAPVRAWTTPAAPCFTVQFHPEACGGPLDTRFLFDKFINLIDAHKGSKEAKGA